MAIGSANFKTVSRKLVTLQVLTPLPLDKMAAISQTVFWNAQFLMKSFVILIQISLNFVPKGPIGNKRALVQVMA